MRSFVKRKKPKDRYIVVDKERVVRLHCICGFYRDIKVNKEDFHNNGGFA